MLSTFPAIDTAVDDIKFSQGLEKLAKVMDRGTLIRSYTAGDLGFILHSRHQYQWHTGYAPPQTVAAPHIGAVIARTLGPRNPAMPAFIDIGQRFDLGEGEELKAFHTAGFLGSEYGPFLIPEPTRPSPAISPPKGMSPSRLREPRTGSTRSWWPKARSASSAATTRRNRCSGRWTTPTACSTARPPRRSTCRWSPRSRTTSTTRGRFGLGCLLARRLVEAGARFIEVTTEYIPFKYWDTHDNGHTPHWST